MSVKSLNVSLLNRLQVAQIEALVVSLFHAVELLMQKKNEGERSGAIGVGDLYTDPQVHSIRRNFGPADMATRGFRQFFKTHAQRNGGSSALESPWSDLYNKKN